MTTDTFQELVIAKLAVALCRLEVLTQEVRKMSAELDALRAQVQQNTTVISSAVTLINGIAARIDAAIAGNQVDRQALVDLSAELKAKDDELAAAVTANTPATPPTP